MFLLLGSVYAESVDEKCVKEVYKEPNFAQAISTCQQAIEFNKADFKLYQALGGAYFATEDYKNAIANYQKVIELNPSNIHYIWHANNMMGRASGYLYNFDSAVEYFRKAIKAEGNNLESHINLAATLRYMKRLDEAKAAYHKALEVAQSNGNKEDIDFLKKEINKYGF